MNLPLLTAPTPKLDFAILFIFVNFSQDMPKTNFGVSTLADMDFRVFDFSTHPKLEEEPKVFDFVNYPCISQRHVLRVPEVHSRRRSEPQTHARPLGKSSSKNSRPRPSPASGGIPSRMKWEIRLPEAVGVQSLPPAESPLFSLRFRWIIVEPRIADYLVNCSVAHVHSLALEESLYFDGAPAVLPAEREHALNNVIHKSKKNIIKKIVLQHQ